MQSPGWRPVLLGARPASVLVAGNDEALAMLLVRALEREGYDVARVDSGRAALTRLGQPDGVDLAILDGGLPDIGGLDVCGRARTAGYVGAIVMVSERASELDRVVGLDAGADDYVDKPFSLAELLARVRAQLRRRVPAALPAPDDGLRIDFAAYRVHAGETEIPVTAKEFVLLAVLVGASEQVISRERLMAEVWDEHWRGSTKVVDVTVGRLRHKLVAAGARERIVTVRGVGYRLEQSG